jgi:hypothetical protein
VRHASPAEYTIMRPMLIELHRKYPDFHATIGAPKSSESESKSLNSQKPQVR